MKLRLYFVLGIMLSHLVAYSQGLGEKEFTEVQEQASDFTSFEISKIGQLKDSVDLSYMMPPAGKQGKKGACWAFATAYVLRSSMDNTRNFLVGGVLDKSKVYSPEFVYQRYKGDVEDCKFGAYSFDMLANLLRDGVVRESDFIYREAACNSQPNSTLISMAKQYAKPGYSVEMVNDDQTIKKLLQEKQPLLVSIKVDSYFCDTTKITSKNPYWRTFKSPKKGTHAMVVVGYSNKRNAFKVLNSWGVGWGVKGYVWIDYSLFNSAMYYCCYPKRELDSMPITDSSEVHPELPDTSSTQQIFENNAPFSTWAKKGYYREFENLKVVIAEFDKDKEFAFIEIRDEDYQLYNNFYIDIKTSKDFYIKGQQYRFTFNNIGNAGFTPKRAVYFTIRKIGI